MERNNNSILLKRSYIVFVKHKPTRLTFKTFCNRVIKVSKADFDLAIHFFFALVDVFLSLALIFVLLVLFRFVFICIFCQKPCS